MYEQYYGLTEKPFSLTPDPKYLYRSQSHANAFELLQYAVQRREGFVVVTGDIGTGKTTLCRALLEQIDRKTFTALILNPFLSEEDLLKRILVDFGVMSREEAKAGRLAGVSKQELIDALQEFLLGLIPLNAGAVLIIDEAQNLPLAVLEQIRILSNLETDKEKLLQIILVGQLNLQTLLRSPELRQLDQRVSIRYELKPLDEETVAAYVAHRLAIAGGSARVAFTSRALGRVHKLSGGIPRLINLICDRALLAGFSARAKRITPEMVGRAAESLDLKRPPLIKLPEFKYRTPIAIGALVVLLASAVSVVTTAWLYERFDVGRVQASNESAARAGSDTDVRPLRLSIPSVAEASGENARTLPDAATLTILAGSYPQSETSDPDIRAMTQWLEAAGYRVYYASIDHGVDGRWQRVLAGAYTDFQQATSDAARIRAAAPELEARVVTAAAATGTNR
jgi:general secretion pathway protein A